MPPDRGGALPTGAANAPTNGRLPMLRRTLLATAALGLGLMTAGGALAAGMDKVKACFVYVCLLYTSRCV